MRRRGREMSRIVKEVGSRVRDVSSSEIVEEMSERVLRRRVREIQAH